MSVQQTKNWCNLIRGTFADTSDGTFISVTCFRGRRPEPLTHLATDAPMGFRQELLDRLLHAVDAPVALTSRWGDQHRMLCARRFFGHLRGFLLQNDIGTGAVAATPGSEERLLTTRVLSPYASSSDT